MGSGPEGDRGLDYVEKKITSRTTALATSSGWTRWSSAYKRVHKISASGKPQGGSHCETRAKRHTQHMVAPHRIPWVSLPRPCLPIAVLRVLPNSCSEGQRNVAEVSGGVPVMVRGPH